MSFKNTYRVRFHAICPVSSNAIEYDLEIVKTDATLNIDALRVAVYNKMDGLYHDEMADNLHDEFGGLQNLTADHSGIRLTTTRGAE